MMSWGVVPDGRTSLSSNRSLSLSVLVIWYIVSLRFLLNPLDLQSSFVQQIVLELIHGQGYDHCLDN
jgi:hypothetical protein